MLERASARTDVPARFPGSSKTLPCCCPIPVPHAFQSAVLPVFLKNFLNNWNCLLVSHGIEFHSVLRADYRLLGCCNPLAALSKHREGEQEEWGEGPRWQMARGRGGGEEKTQAKNCRGAWRI